jgi:hypothetical protein
VNNWEIQARRFMKEPLKLLRSVMLSGVRVGAHYYLGVDEIN